jgi:hypothetical protein
MTLKKIPLKNSKPLKIRHRNIPLMIIVALLPMLIGIGVVLFWATREADSPVAEKIRQIFGIPDPIKEVESPPEVTPPPIPEPAPPPPPPPPPPPKALDVLSWDTYLGRRNLWPKRVSIIADQAIPIHFNGMEIGEIYFIKGQEIEVESLLEGEEIYGHIHNNYFVLPAQFTDLANWFVRQYGNQYELKLAAGSHNNAPETRQSLEGSRMNEAIQQLQKWCMRNYGDVNVEITENALVLRWLPSERTRTDFRFEAQRVAHQYLLIQARLGGEDNYAVCQIRHPGNNELLGTGSMFIPAIKRADSLQP